jgi:hypothetical protein
MAMPHQPSEPHTLNIYGARGKDYDMNISIYFTQEAQEALVE